MLGEYPTSQTSEDQPAPKPTRLYLIIGGAVAAVLAAFALVYWLSLPSTVKTGGPGDSDHPGGGHSDDHLSLARDILADMLEGGPEWLTCSNALKQVELHLNENPQDRPGPLGPEQRSRLTDPKLFDLKPDELAEVERINVPLLDAHYLEMCYLLREAALSLGVEGAPPREQAAAAFAWVVRQVRLREPEKPEPPLPPQFVLRRGWGSAAERGLIFLALLEQLPSPGGTPPVGCLVARAGAADEVDPKLWACGVLVEEGDRKTVLLFDPRLGLALPATLAEAAADANALKPLTVDPKYPYDVDATRVAESGLYVAAPLTALSPRMRYLEAKLAEKPAAAVRLPDPLATLDRLSRATSGLGEKSPPVAVWRPALAVHRRFVPTEQGGADQSRLGQQKFEELVPYDALPKPLRGRDLSGHLLEMRQKLFQVDFLEPFLPRGPRSLLLRGRCDQAVKQLVEMRDHLVQARNAAAQNPVPQTAVVQWVEDVSRLQDQILGLEASVQSSGNPGDRARLEQARAQFDDAFRRGLGNAAVLVRGVVAEHRIPEVTFQLALAQQEAAEQQEQALEQLRRDKHPVPEERARGLEASWKYADNWWAACLREKSPLAAAARLNQARVQERLGRREQAVALLRDLSGEMTPLEKTARLYLAARLEKAN